MHIVKVGSQYVTAAGTLSSRQADALRIHDDSTTPARLVASFRFSICISSASF